MNAETNVPLPPEFLQGPWITTAKMLEWFDVSKECLKSWRARGVVAYTTIGGVIMYNQPWLLQQLSKGWTLKQRRPRKRKH